MKIRLNKNTAAQFRSYSNMLSFASPIWICRELEELYIGIKLSRLINDDIITSAIYGIRIIEERKHGFVTFVLPNVSACYTQFKFNKHGHLCYKAIHTLISALIIYIPGQQALVVGVTRQTSE